MEEGKLDLLNFLLSKGADINAREDFGRIQLFYAIYKENPKLVKYLLSKETDISVRHDGGDTPLHTALKIVYLEIIKLLVSKGVDINIQNDEGETNIAFRKAFKIFRIKWFKNLKALTFFVKIWIKFWVF